MRRFAVLLTHCDVKRLKKYDKELAETKKKVSAAFRNVAGWDQEPAYVWPVSLKKRDVNDSEDD